jgi:hypothetical protein
MMKNRLALPTLFNPKSEPLRSCLKTQDFAHETHEKDEKSRIIIIFFCLYFRAFRVLRRQKNRFSNSFSTAAQFPSSG